MSKLKLKGDYCQTQKERDYLKSIVSALSDKVNTLISRVAELEYINANYADTIETLKDRLVMRSDRAMALKFAIEESPQETTEVGV